MRARNAKHLENFSGRNRRYSRNAECRWETLKSASNKICILFSNMQKKQEVLRRNAKDLFGRIINVSLDFLTISLDIVEKNEKEGAQ